MHNQFCQGDIVTSFFFFRKATCNLLEVVKKAAVVAPRNSLSSRRREGNGMKRAETPQGTVYSTEEDQAENHTQHHIKCRKSWFKIFQHVDVSRLSRLIYYFSCSKGCRMIEAQEERQ